MPPSSPIPHVTQEAITEPNRSPRMRLSPGSLFVWDLKTMVAAIFFTGATLWGVHNAYSDMTTRIARMELVVMQLSAATILCEPLESGTPGRIACRLIFPPPAVKGP